MSREMESASPGVRDSEGGGLSIARRRVGLTKKFPVVPCFPSSVILIARARCFLFYRHLPDLNPLSSAQKKPKATLFFYSFVLLVLSDINIMSRRHLSSSSHLKLNPPPLFSSFFPFCLCCFPLVQTDDRRDGHFNPRIKATVITGPSIESTRPNIKKERIK